MKNTLLLHNINRNHIDAARLALQSATAAAATFSLMQSLGLNEKFVAILSAVLVVQPSLGTTIGAAAERFAAALVGCAIGLTCLYLLPDGYGTAAALAISMFVMNAIAAFRPDWRYGVVAAVALSLGSESSAMLAATERSIAIGTGIAVGILVSLLVWPEKSETRVERHIRNALRAARDRLQKTLALTDGGDEEGNGNARRRFLRELSAARETIKHIRFADSESFKSKVEAVERFQQGMTMLDRVAEGGAEITDVAGEVAERLTDFKTLSCKILEDIVSGSVTADERHAKLDRCLQTLRDLVSSDDTRGLSHVRRNALVFALGEVEWSLDRLRDLYEES